jgi:heme oxygenase
MTMPETGFAADLRAATWPKHQSAETTAFWASITGSAFAPAAYAAMQSQLFLVYDALEAAIDDAVDEASDAGDAAAAIAQLYAPELARAAALRADLTDLLGPNWAERIHPLPATTRYVERIAEIALSAPLLLAHHYTRYLGDLSGGLYIGRRVRSNLGREGDSGVRFYVFDEIADADAFKRNYRAGLDALPLSDSERSGVIDEAIIAYDLNTDMLNDLDLDFSRAVA